MTKVAMAQFSGYRDKEANLEKAANMARQAAAEGARIVCLPELCNTMYFCWETNPEHFGFAETIPGPSVERMAGVAKECGIVLVYPLFEKTVDGEYYNTAVVLGPNGELVGKYRKTSIPMVLRPTGEMNNEKYYFKPGNLGFPVFPTPFGLNIGILICYDRHFPEAARVLGLRGAHLVFVPTATHGLTQPIWELELRSMAVYNLYYVGGVNKVGADIGGSGKHYFGTSMFVNPRGEVMAKAGEQHDEIIYADIDRELIAQLRHMWAFYRDRRPDVYGPLVE